MNNYGTRFLCWIAFSEVAVKHFSSFLLAFEKYRNWTSKYFKNLISQKIIDLIRVVCTVVEFSTRTPFLIICQFLKFRLLWSQNKYSDMNKCML